MRWFVAALGLSFVAAGYAQNMAFAFDRTINVDGRNDNWVRALPNGNFAVLSSGDTATLYIVTRTNVVSSVSNLAGYGSFSPRDIKVDATGNIFIVGGSLTGGAGTSNTYIYKYNQSGALVWKKGLDAAGNAMNDIARKVVLHSDGSIFILGTYSGGMIEQSYVVKLDGAGALLWRRRLDTYNAYANDLQLTPDGAKLVVHQTYFPSPDTLAVMNSTTGAVTFHLQLGINGYANCMAVDNGFAYLGGYTERTQEPNLYDSNPTVFKLSLTTGNQAGFVELGNTDYMEMAQSNSVRQILRDPSGNLTVHYNLSEEGFSGTAVGRLLPNLSIIGGNSFEKGSTTSFDAQAMILDPFNGNLTLASRFYDTNDQRNLITRQNVGQVGLFQEERPGAPNATRVFMQDLALNKGGDVLVVGMKDFKRHWMFYRMAPQAIADTRATPRNTPLVSNVLTNDRFTAGVTVRISGQPAHGTVTVDGVTGDFVYTPNNNYTGQDTFSYRLSKPGCTYSYTTVTVNVGP